MELDLGRGENVLDHISIDENIERIAHELESVQLSKSTKQELYLPLVRTINRSLKIYVQSPGEISGYILQNRENAISCITEYIKTYVARIFAFMKAVESMNGAEDMLCFRTLLYHRKSIRLLIDLLTALSIGDDEEFEAQRDLLMHTTHAYLVLR